MKIIKILLIGLLTCFTVFSVWGAPVYNDTVHKYNAGWYTKLTNQNKLTLERNIKALFFPVWDASYNLVWKEFRIILIWIFVLMIIRAGTLMLLNADKEEEMSKYKANLMYLVYGWFLIFGAVWLVWDVLQVWYSTATIESVTLWTQWTILAKLLVFLKVLAYFVAIIMVVFYGFQIIKANDTEDAITKWKTWLLNVLIAVFSIKILDYLYFIAQQKDFKTKGDALLATISKGLWWIAWIILVLALVYSAFILFTSRGEEDSFKKAKNIIKNTFIIVVIIFMFVMIMHNMIGRFGS